MNLKKHYLTKNECYKIGQKITPKGVMWHSTGANNPTLKRYVPDFDGTIGKNLYGNHWDQFRPDGRQVCVHAFIGQLKDGSVATVQTLPFTTKGWHAGGSANSSYIGFEICEDDLKSKSYFEKVYKEAVEFTAYICKKYDLNPEGKNVIIDHAKGNDLGIASNHGDVQYWFKKYGKTLSDVRKDVKNAMGGKVETPKKEESSSSESFKVKVRITNLNIRKSPGLNAKVVGTCPRGSYTIIDVKTEDGYRWGKLKSGKGWIALKYTSKI